MQKIKGNFQHDFLINLHAIQISINEICEYLHINKFVRLI